MNIFITADHHFHHKNIIEYCRRKAQEESSQKIKEKEERILKSI